MEVICIEDQALYALIDRVVEHIKEKNGVQGDKWVSDDEAMRLLRIKSKTTLLKWRTEGRIRFSQPQKKVILYDADSIQEFLNKNAHEIF